MDAAEDAEFDAFVRARWPAFARTAYLLCAGDLGHAEDLVQTALARTLRAWPRLTDRGDLDGYVYRVMVRTHATQRRRRWRGEVPTEHLPEPPAAGSATDAVEDADQLSRALAGLSRRQRAAVVLRFYDDHSEQEVADLLGCSLGTVKTHTSRGLARLRELLDTDTERSLG
ncbi:SigE family RNA polymerase sigma factor [Acidothermaceae bacterium B102]|nr:SigE family RNA polymerase sigma factor [Acidothermaceae bacterium B102]BEP15938.1 SigE family RNA polymerase sigma factor [Acidothermaceae bacterium B102]